MTYETLDETTKNRLNSLLVEGATVVQVGAALGLSRSVARRILISLLNSGSVEKIPAPTGARGRPPMKFRLAQ